jgi:hypothetical protein
MNGGGYEVLVLRACLSTSIPSPFKSVRIDRGELVVVGSEQLDEAILGRDVLNQLVVTLNGLASAVEISL